MAEIESVKTEIRLAIEELGLSEDQIRLLPDEEGLRVYSSAVAHFVASGGRRWWWEDFRAPATRVPFNDGLAFQYITKIVPTDEKIWFIAEDDELLFYPVYEAFPESAQKVIGECYGFEYYLVARDFSWLLCETHHSVMIAIGTEVEENLRALDLWRSKCLGES